MPLLARIFILLFFLSFSYTLIDECLYACFDHTTVQIDDIDSQETDSEEETDDRESIEKDQNTPPKHSFLSHYSYVFNKNNFLLDFVPSLLSKQYALNTPPPEIC